MEHGKEDRIVSSPSSSSSSSDLHNYKTYFHKLHYANHYSATTATRHFAPDLLHWLVSVETAAEQHLRKGEIVIEGRKIWKKSLERVQYYIQE